MASPNDARQQTATQQQDGNSVVFVDTHLTKLDERKIKSIGFYSLSDLAEINQLLVDLHRIFPKQYGLLDRQRIFLRLNGESNTSQLVTDLNFPEAFENAERQKLLFLSDLARIIIGLAKTFYAIWQDDSLKEYTRNFDELEKLREWAATGDPEYISEFDLARNAYKIQALLDEITAVFEEHIGANVGTAEAAAAVKEVVATAAGTATVPIINEGTGGTGRSRTQEIEPEEQSVLEELEAHDLQEDITLTTESLFISSAAYSNLITQFLEKAGLTEADLPAELQQQLAELKATLRSRLFDIVEKLSPDLKSKLLDHNLRIYLYQKLLIELQQDPLFFVTLNQFYQGYTRFIYQKSGLAVAEERVSEIERYFATMAADAEIEEVELNEVLEKIRAEIRAWKAQVAEEAEKERQQQQPQTVIVQEDHAVNKLPPPRTHFLPQQETQLETFLTSNGYEPQVRKIIQDQSARVLWGTLAELFKDDVEQLNKLPPGLHDHVYSQTLTYILSLSANDLDQLRRSPSTLIRHIKNNAYRIMGDTAFQHIYSQYTDTKTATVVSRANRVEKETNWAYNQLVFELFSAHNITDSTVPDEPELQDLFDELKKELYEDVFVFIEEMKTEDLLSLYVHAKDRSEFLKEIYKFLNADSTFITNLNAFYHNLLTHYQKTQQYQQHEELKRSLNNLVQLDAAVFEVKASAPPPQVLFDNAIEKVLKTDSKVVLDQSDVVLKTLVLNLGLEATLNLIQKNRVEILSSVFQLPPGMLNDANVDEYRAILSEYARARASELVANTAGPADATARLQLMYPGLRLDRAETSFTKTPTPSSTAASQIESVRTVQTVVQANGKDGDEVVAEGSDLKTIKEKRDIVMKIFGSEWGQLSQQDQAAIYIYYGLPFNEQSVKNDISYKLPFVFEYIDFRAKKDYDKLLERISHEYELHGKKRYNKLLTAGYLEATPSADHQRKINQLILAYQAYNFAKLDAAQQLVIAQRAGYETTQAFLAENAVLAQNALSNNPELNNIIQQMAFIDELLPEDLAAETDVTNYQFLENLRTNQGQVTPEETVAGGGAAAAAALSPQASILGALKQLVGKKAGGEAIKQGASSLAVKAGLGAVSGGLATAITIGFSLLQNKKFREFATYSATAFIASLLGALSTIGGILGSTLMGSFGFLTAGPIGAIGGGIAGAYTGAAIFPQQWGNWMGFSPRQAPGLNFLYPENNASITDPSMQSIRGGQAPVTAAAANPTITGGTTSLGVTPGAPTAIATTGTSAAATGATVQAAATSGVFGNFLGMSIGLAAPMIGLISVVVLTTFTILVITGAFLVPVPTRDSNWKGDTSSPQPVESKFLDLTKKASITQIENNTDTPVTYTIKVSPKNGYAIRIIGASDTFNLSGQSEVKLVSGITEASFPVDPITEPVEISYTVNIGKGLVDTRVTNTLVLSFEAINRNGYTETPHGSFRTSASVRVGNPIEGCWPVTGTITQLPGGSASHGPLNEDAYDIGVPSGTLVFAPYSGNYCIQPPSLNALGQYAGYGIHSTLTTNVNGSQLIFIFGHLQGYPDLPLGPDNCTQVYAGQLVAYTDNTGNSTGAHLHYELLKNAAGIKLEELVPQESGIPSNGETIRDCRQ